MQIKRTTLAFAGTALALGLAATPAMGAGGAGKPTASPSASAPQNGPLASEVAAKVKPDAAAQDELAGVNKRIRDYSAKHPGKYTFGSYVDARTNELVVQTDASSDVIAKVVGAQDASSGSGPEVKVEKTKIKDHYSRKSDTPNYWGGAGITASVGTPWCSSGFTVQNSAGTRFQVTAGHCFNNGQNVYTENGGSYVGVVSGNGLSVGQDMELIGGSSYWGWIYTGGVDSSTGIKIVGSGDPTVGYANYCHSGRTTGENCGHTAISNTAQVCTSSGCKYPVIAWQGGNLIQGGDSGSPFYIKDSTQAWARGINIASGGSTAYAEKWSRIASRFGVSITTQ